MLSNDQEAVKSYGFGLQAFKKYPEIIPLVGIMGVAVVGVATFCTYALFKKTDVQLDRSSQARWQTVDVNKPQKFITLNQQYGEDAAVTALKQEIYEAYKNQ